MPLTAEAMLIVTTNEIPGHRITQVHGDVFGLIVRAAYYFSNIGASFRTLVTSEHALQRQIRRRGLQPRRIGRAMRLDVCHAGIGKRPHQLRAADKNLSLILRATAMSEEPVICVDDLRGNQPVEESPDAPAYGGIRYHLGCPADGATDMAARVTVGRRPRTRPR